MNFQCHGVRTIARTICAAVFLCAAAGASAQTATQTEEPAVRASATATDANGETSQGVRATGSWFRPDRLDLNVYGLSYHPDRETVHRLNLDNEVNPGLGLRYKLDEDARGVTFAEVGVYQDSGSHWAKFAGLGYQFKFGNNWRIGGALAAMSSQTYNNGIGFIAMIPMITYDFGRIKVNAVYLPKFGGYNEVASFGLYLGLPFRN